MKIKIGNMSKPCSIRGHMYFEVSVFEKSRINCNRHFLLSFVSFSFLLQRHSWS